MRRITMWALITATIFVLLFSYHTSTNSNSVTAMVAPVAAPTTTSATASPSSTDTPAAASSAATPTDTPVSATKNYTGASVDTRWGPVQVQITVAAGKITKATTVVYPQENRRDVEINAVAVPALEQETVAAQSANIDMVSGATVTSDGYIQSLQSALDQAKIG